MKTKFWMLLLILLFSLPSFSQNLIPQDTITSISETTVINDITQSTIGQIIPNEGFSTNSLWRGVLGMLVLIFISYLFSANRKAINWKTVGIGLSIQLLIAIGVLKVPFIQSAFEAVGQVFVSILDYTRAGSQFLFEGLDRSRQSME